MLLTVHRWFAYKTCPGDWLYNRLDELATKVTMALDPKNKVYIPEMEDDEDMTQERFNEFMENWLTEQAEKEPADWSKQARDWAENKGFIQGDGSGRKMYKKPLTREEFI